MTDNKPMTVNVSKVLNQAIERYSEMLEKKIFDMPDNYSYKNAIQQARYLLTKPAESGKNKGMAIVDFCTPTSILQSVMEMAQKGLNPDKKQCYFIPYGNTCTLSVSYQGNVAIAKRDGEDIGDVFGYPVYKDDTFELDFNLKKGIMEVKNYKPDVSKWSKHNIVGAFCVITNMLGYVKYTEYMTMEQIKDAWNMGFAKGQSPAHKNFPDQQAIKTVKNRAVKSFINTTDDTNIVNDEDRATSYTDYEIKEEIQDKANKKSLDIDAEFEEIKEEEEPKKVDKETGEIIEDDNIEVQSDFFGDDFVPLDKAPF